MKNKCCVVIPIYKKFENLNDFEKKTLERTIALMSGKYSIIFVCHNGFETCGYASNDHSVFFYFFDKKYFYSVYGYNELMLSDIFYETFNNYDYMLLVQLDAFIFQNKLEDFLDLGYDYIGCLHYTPYTKNKLIDGNGGFSLRKIDAFITASKSIKKDLNNKFDWEDILYSYWYKDKMNIAPESVSLKFGWQQDPQMCYELNNKELPFGCHKPYIFGKNFEPYKIALK